ncbi:MAG: lipid kinase YegS [Verrucomicrobiota bacterium]
MRLILHGKAAQRKDVRAAVEVLRGEGVSIDVRVTWEGGDAPRLAREAVEDGVETVVAAGGDGTLNEVASTIAACGGGAGALPSFGILPLGTANDFARSCRVPMDAEGALRVAAFEEARAIDLCRSGERSFINVATGGVGTVITVETPEELKKVLGGAAYFVTALKRLSQLEAIKGSFWAPDFRWEGDFVVLGIGNGRQAGGGNVLCPEARIDDGLMDVRILPDLGNEDNERLLRDLVSDGLKAIERRVVGVRVPWVEIEAPEAMQINFDGEPMKRERFRFEVLAGAIRAHLPADCPLVGDEN